MICQFSEIVLVFTALVLVVQGDLVIPMENTGDFVGNNASFLCGIDGQEAWEVMQWVKLSPNSIIIAEDANSLNPAKYVVTERYRLTILHLDVEDESQYACQFNVQSARATLSVAAAPRAIELKKQSSGIDTNLTCISYESRPMATFQWYKGDLNLTVESYGPYADLNETLYGDSWSDLPVSMTQDEGQEFTCVISFPGVPTSFSKHIILNSGASVISGSYVAILNILVMTLMHLQ